MRYFTVFALVAAATAAPLTARSADPQLLNGINDAVGSILGGIPVIGGLAGSITDAIGDILNIPRDIAGGIAGDFDRDDYKRVQDSLDTIRATMQPYVASKDSVTRTSQDDPISDIVGNIPIVGPLASQITSGTFDLISSIMNIPNNVVGGILGGVNSEDQERIKLALNDVEAVFRAHL